MGQRIAFIRHRRIAVFKAIPKSASAGSSDSEKMGTVAVGCGCISIIVVLVILFFLFFSGLSCAGCLLGAGGAALGA